MTGMAVSVCLTPAAPSPLPIPYPTMGTVAEGIIDPCMRTKIEGAKILTVGGCMKACHGNEPGTLKEVVSLNTAGPCFPWLGAPNVFIELGMAGITGSMGQMNKSITVGAGASASGAGGKGGGGGGAGGGAGGPGGGGPQGGGNGGGGGGGSNQGAGPPSPPAPPGADGQGKAGHPVDVITGTMFTVPIVDFELGGPLPLQWVRQYRTSAVRRRSGLGWGWTHSFGWTAEVGESSVTVLDSEGSPVLFPPVEDGEIAYAPFGRSLERRGAELVLATRDGVERVLRRESRGPYRLHAVRDRSGNEIELSWHDGELVALTDSVGRRIEREQVGNVILWRILMTDEKGTQHRRLGVAYEIDARGDLVKVVDSGGVAVEYRYDEEHFLTEERLPDGMVYHFRYEDGPDGKRRCVETWGELPGGDILAEIGGRGACSAKGLFHVQIAYGLGPFESTVTDATGGVHRYHGNALGLIERYVDPLGRATRLSYDVNGHLVSVQDAMGYVDHTRHDAMGRPLTSTDVLGRQLRFRRDPQGNAIELVDPAGAVWKMEHDAAGRLVQRTDPSGAMTRCEYNARGRAVRTSGPGGTEETRYDAHANLIERIGVRGETWRYTWDLLGLPVRLETPTGAAYALSYDSRGELVEVVGPHGRRTERQFDARRRVVAERHPGGGITTSRFVGEALVERSFADGSRLRWGYDAMLRPVWIENAAGERHLFEYDAAGQLVREQTFAGHEHRYEYDLLGRCIARTGADGRALRLVLDAAGQVVRREHDDGTSIVLDRDVRGFVTRAVDGIASVELARDQTGRVVRETQRCGGWTFSVQHEFDSLGYEVGTRYSTGWYVSRRRGRGGVIEQLTVHGADGSVEEALAFEHGPEEVVRRLDRRTGVAITRDRLGRPVRVRALGEDGASVRERAFEWAPQPGVATVVDSAHGRRSYYLDAIGRVRRASGLGVEEKYDYSAQGTPSAGSEGATSIGRGGRKRATGAARFLWDASGRLAQRLSDSPASSWTYAYDGENRLIEARRHDGFVVRFVYDAFGRRLALLRSDGTSTWFGWDGDSVVEERPSAGHAVRRVFREDGYTPIAELEGEAGWRLVATDAASTPWLYLSADGAVASLDLDPMGKEVRVEGRVGLLRFAGQRADVETGLRYNRHRYYSPELGTFLTPDPLGQAGSVHDVGFVPNATEYIDPLGLIIIIGYTANDDHPDEHGRGETRRAAMERAAATGQQVVRADQLRGPHNPNGISLEGETHVEVVTHGSTRGGQVTFQNGQRNWVNGRQLGDALNQAGLQPNSEVVLVACNASTTPTERPRQSVIAGVNQATGCPTSGPSGIAYVRPYGQQYCGVCPPTPGAGGSVDLTDGHWARATGPRGGTPTVSQVSTPSTQHADTWHDPTAPTGRGPHGGGFPGAPPHQD
ncbi:PAAR-like domain-containing protein [Sorangium sp. So ce1078]|uniref:PAAR-like domain-containing protein n=1 Tax=Sorangium sp. So ce1078 TaxID=3133329 RepID=UPI003F640B38